MGLEDAQLLDLRLCDLDLKIEGSDLEPSLRQLDAELAARRLEFRPHYWLSDEWFTPDGIPGIAVPFYLAHPRLARLELHQMFEVEGGRVSVADGWQHGPETDKGARWEPAELGSVVAELLAEAPAPAPVYGA